MQYFEWQNIDLVTGFPLHDPVCPKRPKDPEIAPLKTPVYHHVKQEPKGKKPRTISWALMNPTQREKQLAAIKAWRHKNKERVNEYQREYHRLWRMAKQKKNLAACIN